MNLACLPSEPGERHQAMRWMMALGSLAMVLLVVVLATRGSWPGAMESAIKAGKKVPLDRLVKTWAWRGLAVDCVILFGLAATAGWWSGSVRTSTVAAPARRGFWLVASGILVLAAGLRTPRLGLSFYNDEAHNFVRMTSGAFKDDPSGKDSNKWRPATWTETLWQNSAGNNSQPHSLLSRLCFQAWKSIASAADGEVREWPVRIPSLIAGLTCLAILGATMRSVGGEIVGWLTMLAGAVHGWHVRFSTEARGYSLMAMGIALMMWFSRRAVAHGRWRDWMGYGLSNFLALWAFPGCLYWVLAMNGVLVVQLGWSAWRNKSGVEPFVRLVVVGVLAVVLAVGLMLPLIPQLLEAVKNVPGLRGEMRADWWQDVGGYAVFGARWQDADATSPISVAMVRILASSPWAWLGVLASVLILVAGSLKLWSRDDMSRWFIIAAVGSLILGWADMARQSRYLNHWYLFYTLPALLCAFGQGVVVLADRLATKGLGRAVVACVLLIAGLGVTTSIAWGYRHRSKGDERSGVVQVRGAIYPHYEANPDALQPLLAAIWSNAPIYDPLAVPIKVAADFDALKAKAQTEKRPLFVIMGHRESAIGSFPTIVPQLESPAFEEVAVYRGLDEAQYTQRLFKMK
ncbi:MAG: glycosyltransferase family 39 protein [Verrucomicrobiaceae bacterium]|nr:glycosyltransferase family 39 protein [Verrucomicrobiaceae bacterium]